MKVKEKKQAPQQEEITEEMIVEMQNKLTKLI